MLFYMGESNRHTLSGLKIPKSTIKDTEYVYDKRHNKIIQILPNEYYTNYFTAYLDGYWYGVIEQYDFIPYNEYISGC